MKNLFREHQRINKTKFDYQSLDVIDITNIIPDLVKQQLNNSILSFVVLKNNIKNSLTKPEKEIVDYSDDIFNDIIDEHDAYHKRIYTLLQKSKNTQYYHKLREISLINKSIRKKFITEKINIHLLRRYNQKYTEQFLSLYELLFNVK